MEVTPVVSPLVIHIFISKPPPPSPSSLSPRRLVPFFPRVSLLVPPRERTLSFLDTPPPPRRLLPPLASSVLPLLPLGPSTLEKEPFFNASKNSRSSKAHGTLYTQYIFARTVFLDAPLPSPSRFPRSSAALLPRRARTRETIVFRLAASS